MRRYLRNLKGQSTFSALPLFPSIECENLEPSLSLHTAKRVQFPWKPTAHRHRNLPTHALEPASSYTACFEWPSLLFHTDHTSYPTASADALPRMSHTFQKEGVASQTRDPGAAAWTANGWKLFLESRRALKVLDEIFKYIFYALSLHPKGTQGNICFY